MPTSVLPNTPPAVPRRRPGRLLLAATASVALLASACGSGDETLDASTDDDATTETTSGDETAETTAPADDESPEPGQDGQDGRDGEAQPVAGESDYTPTLPMLDMTSPTIHTIDEIVMSDDGLTLGVRYQGAAEPCSGAVASVAEDDSTIIVTLETGLNPEAAAMSCIAEVMSYELAVGLDAPVGDREIISVGTEDGSTGSGDSDTSDGGSADGDTSGGDTGGGDTSSGDTSGENDDAMEDGDGLSSPESFVGLTLDEAGAKADAEGREWRISRQDDEQFGLTADYNADRVTFEVDAGVVTAVVAG